MILERIVARTRERLTEQKASVPLVELKGIVADMNTSAVFPLENALRKPGISLICEVKKASPSKGIIAEEFPYIEIARQYEQAGAAAVSVLTEPYFFLGKNEYLEEIRKNIRIPILRKDFTIDEYMIYEAKALGADAVLLITGILTDAELVEFAALSHALGMSALVEVHDERELERALHAGARLIGVNNRNLQTFEVDLANSLRLRNRVPEGILFLSESGVRTPEDVRLLKNSGVDGVLIGEYLMRLGNIGKGIQELTRHVSQCDTCVGA